MQAFIQTEGNVLVQELESITLDAINNRTPELAKLARRFSIFGSVSLAGILRLADRHLANRTWVLHVLDRIKDPYLLLEIVLGASAAYVKYSDAFHQVLIKKILATFDEKPHLINLEVVSKLVRHSEYTQSWLDNRIDEIEKICITAFGSYEFRSTVRQWPELADRLRSQVHDFDRIIMYPYEVNGFEARQPKSEIILKSPAYQYLYKKYIDALDGDAYTLYHLVQVARQWRGNIPFRAVAVHFIGKLYQQYDVALTLRNYVRMGSDSWRMELSPIRCEAGEALMNLPSPETWEALVESVFISPRNELSVFQNGWIAYITDVLSGQAAKTYEGFHYGEPPNRPWFKALAEISEEELQDLTKHIR